VVPVPWPVTLTESLPAPVLRAMAVPPEPPVWPVGVAVTLKVFPPPPASIVRPDVSAAS